MTKNYSQVDKLLSWRSVVEAYQTCNQKYSLLMSHFDLTSAQFDVLMAIDGLGQEAKPKRIAERLLVTKGNITNVTKRLIERELLLQQADSDDGRSFFLRLSPSGKEIVERAKCAAKTFIDEQLSPFSDNEIEEVGALMRKMRTHLNHMNVTSILAQIGEKP